jgi:hypothetical protein
MQKIALKYGFRMFLALVVLFGIVHFIGLSQNYNLRVLNGFIHLTFLYLAIKAYRSTFPDSVNNYISGVAVGMYMTLVASVLFAIALNVYLTLDEPFFLSIKENFPYPESFTPFSASLVIVVEGVAVSLIGGYIVTRIIDNLLEEGRKY